MIQKPYVIGISGGSGSGKTFFLNCFLKQFATHEIAYLSQDDYYIPANTQSSEENKHYNFDIPEAFDRAKFHQDLSKLIKGQKVIKESYTFNNPALQSETLEINPAPILLIEGLFIFHFQEINALLDHRIFLQADDSIALERRIKRDFSERGYNQEEVLYKWNHHVQPAYQEFLLPYKNQCDQIIDNHTNNDDEIQFIVQNIASYLKQAFFN